MCTSPTGAKLECQKHTEITNYFPFKHYMKADLELHGGTGGHQTPRERAGVFWMTNRHQEAKMNHRIRKVGKALRDHQVQPSGSHHSHCTLSQSAMPAHLLNTSRDGDCHLPRVGTGWAIPNILHLERQLQRHHLGALGPS